MTSDKKEGFKCEVDNIKGLTEAAKTWLLQVAKASEECRYKDLDALLVYAARIISRLSL